MDASSGSERRAVSRVAGHTLQPIRLRHQTTGHEYLAIVHDISIVGIGFVAQNFVDAGTRFFVEPANTRRRLREELTAEVRHTSRHDHQDFVVGCQFSRLLTLDDMLSFG